MPNKRDGMEVLTGVRRVKMSNGETLAICPLTIGDYVSARQEALDKYRRDKISVYAKNLDLLPAADRTQILADAFSRAEDLTYEDLPAKSVANPETGATHEVEFALWWMAETPEGMMFAVWLSVKREPSQSHMTQDDVIQLFTDEDGVNQSDLEAIAQEVGDLSSPKIAGNGEPPLDAGAAKRRRRRKRRRKG